MVIGLVQVLTWLALVSVTFAVPHDLQGRATLIPPSDDPFYAVPQDGLNDIAPGTILRHRAPPAPIAVFGLAPINLKASHQILYRTTDSVGKATATVLTVLIPYNANYGKVISQQVSQDASFRNCAPSYAFQFASESGGLLGTLLPQVEILLTEAALERGWVVIVPDHLGPNAAFSANRLSGQSTLDGIRAALNSAHFTDIKKDANIAMWGYSGGALAAALAVELQPTYAPELKIVGAAIGGTIPNATTSTTKMNKSVQCGLLPASMVGLANQYPYVAETLEKHLLPQYRPLFQRVANQCLTANILDFLFKDVLSMFDDPSIPFTDPEILRILSENSLGQAVPKIPLFVYKSIGDEISPISETDALVKKYCAGGASVQYQRDLVSSHTLYSIIGAPKAFSWLIDVLDGKGSQAGCSTKTVASSLLDPSTIEVLPGFIIDALLDLLGKPVGPRSIGIGIEN